jgi:hypothetical protein
VNRASEVERSRPLRREEQDAVRPPTEFPTEWCIADDVVDSDAEQRCPGTGDSVHYGAPS